jgi:hypothetical protein
VAGQKQKKRKDKSAKKGQVKGKNSTLTKSEKEQGKRLLILLGAMVFLSAAFIIYKIQ